MTGSSVVSHVHIHCSDDPILATLRVTGFEKSYSVSVIDSSAKDASHQDKPCSSNKYIMGSS